MLGVICVHFSQLVDHYRAYRHTPHKSMFMYYQYRALQWDNVGFSLEVGPTHQAQPLLYCW